MSDLGVVVNIILKRMRETKVVPDSMIPSLFSCVEVLLGFNSVLLKKFKDGEGIGKSFIAMAQFLKMYSIYCVNEPKAEELVDQLMKKSSFKSFLDDLHKLPELHGQKFRDYLMKPVQRLVRFSSLLSRISLTFFFFFFSSSSVSAVIRFSSASCSRTRSRSTRTLPP